ncbi:MAG TPA: hypothetical protein VKP64_02325 [Mycobacteriales bacterium]|nr:hypothetical protein [Mycobacteriales bacterium]
MAAASEERDYAAELAAGLIEQEALALLTRLGQLRPFVLTETMVLSAALPYRAHRIIERFLHESRSDLRRQIRDYLAWLRGPGRTAQPGEQQRRFVVIRLRFNDVLSQLDLFNEVISQRSETATGVWLSGLDALAADALADARWPGQVPPVICYLARGPGAAIRRARTRLPGGRPNPVAIIRVPRERMIGHGVASSLVHEVGHQAAAVLGLVESLRRDVRGRQAASGPAGERVWASWERTVSECVADFWSIGKLGISSTLGLLAVVSLPRFFVFRPSGDDPHPMPYLRVLLSGMIGDTLYPHPQWAALAAAWKAYYPTDGLPADQRRTIADQEASLPEMAELLAGHRPPALNGLRLADVMPTAARRPERLLDLHREWRDDIAVLARQAPTLVFAVAGQARAAGRLPPARESEVLSAVLTAWAVRSSLDVREREVPFGTPSAPAAASSALPAPSSPWLRLLV